MDGADPKIKTEKPSPKEGNKRSPKSPSSRGKPPRKAKEASPTPPPPKSSTTNVDLTTTESPTTSSDLVYKIPFILNIKEAMGMNLEPPSELTALRNVPEMEGLFTDRSQNDTPSRSPKVYAPNTRSADHSNSNTPRERKKEPSWRGDRDNQKDEKEIQLRPQRPSGDKEFNSREGRYARDSQSNDQSRDTKDRTRNREGTRDNNRNRQDNSKTSQEKEQERIEHMRLEELATARLHKHGMFMLPSESTPSPSSNRSTKTPPGLSLQSAAAPPAAPTAAPSAPSVSSENEPTKSSIPITTSSVEPSKTIPPASSSKKSSLNNAVPPSFPTINFIDSLFSTSEQPIADQFGWSDITNYSTNPIESLLEEEDDESEDQAVFAPSQGMKRWFGSKESVSESIEDKSAPAGENSRKELTEQEKNFWNRFVTKPEPEKPDSSSNVTLEEKSPLVKSPPFAKSALPGSPPSAIFGAQNNIPLHLPRAVTSAALESMMEKSNSSQVATGSPLSNKIPHTGASFAEASEPRLTLDQLPKSPRRSAQPTKIDHVIPSNNNSRRPSLEPIVEVDEEIVLLNAGVPSVISITSVSTITPAPTAPAPTVSTTPSTIAASNAKSISVEELFSSFKNINTSHQPTSHPPLPTNVVTETAILQSYSNKQVENVNSSPMPSPFPQPQSNPIPMNPVEATSPNPRGRSNSNSKKLLHFITGGDSAVHPTSTNMPSESRYHEALPESTQFITSLLFASAPNSFASSGASTSNNQPYPINSSHREESFAHQNNQPGFNNSNKIDPSRMFANFQQSQQQPQKPGYDAQPNKFMHNQSNQMQPRQNYVPYQNMMQQPQNAYPPHPQDQANRPPYTSQPHNNQSSPMNAPNDLERWFGNAAMFQNVNMARPPPLPQNAKMLSVEEIERNSRIK